MNNWITRILKLKPQKTYSRNISLQKYLKTLRGIQKISTGYYVFIYDNCWCSGVVSFDGKNELLTIKPMKDRHDIGRGNGQSVTLKF